MHRQYVRRDAAAVVDRRGVASEQGVGLHPSAVSLDLRRIRVDDATELADRLLVAARLDEGLPVLGSAVEWGGLGRTGDCCECSRDGDDGQREERKDEQAFHSVSFPFVVSACPALAV